MKFKNSIRMFALVVFAAWGGSLCAQDTIVDKTPQDRKVLVEEFTGLHCPNCPSGHKMAGEIEALYPEDCFFVNIHAGALATPRPGETDLRSAYGESLAKRADVTGIPSAEISRHRFMGESGLATSDRGKWQDYVEELLWNGDDRAAAAVNIAARAGIDWRRRELSVTVQLYYTASSAQPQNYLHVMLVQDNIKGSQDGSDANPGQVLPDGSYLHRHVLRDLLTDIAGDAVQTTTQGSFVSRTYTRELPEDYNYVAVDFLQLQVVAFVTESEEEVLNACRTEPVFTNGPEYVFQLRNIETSAQNTCDNAIRMGIDLMNRNPETAQVKEITFLFRTPQGREQEYTATVQDFTAGSVAHVEVPSVMLDKAGVNDTLRVQVKAVNGTPLTMLQEPVTVVAHKDYFTVREPEVTLDIWQDRWGSEISWAFTDENGQVLEKVDAYSDLNASDTERHTHALTLPHGCNTFVIRDMAKDGINNISGEGYLELKDKNGNRVAYNNGKYSDSLVWMVRYSPVSVQEFGNIRLLRIYPNPAHEQAEISFTLTRAASLRYGIRSIDGKEQVPVVHYSGTAGINTLQVSLRNLPAGMYIVWISGEEGLSTVKVVVR